ncbi:MAG TPA: membrane protein insertion efficiency factor YidD [bacterium]|nr:membrane protein insertion efficiency factor YidD [bacterium]
MASLPPPAPPSLRGPLPGSTPQAPLGGPRQPDFRTILGEPATSAATAGPLGLLEFYRTVISPLDGPHCHMAPTCSLYSQQAFKEEGVLLGFLLTADRLLHEADEEQLVPSYEQGGSRHYLDPLENNIYWLPAWLR